MNDQEMVVVKTRYQWVRQELAKKKMGYDASAGNGTKAGRDKSWSRHCKTY